MRFLARPNRFLAHVRPDPGPGRSFRAHVPNPGRMEELLLPGRTIGWVVPGTGPGRATDWDLVAVRWGRTTVSLDARVGNRIVSRALAAGLLDDFGSGSWEPEYGLESERFDFAQRSPGRRRPRALLEVKCSNLRVGDTALFPDAPTQRGTRQVRALARWARRGVSGSLLFIVQRNDCRRFRINSVLDPELNRAIGSAQRAGVLVRADDVRVEPGRVTWGRPLPVTGVD